MAQIYSNPREKKKEDTATAGKRRGHLEIPHDKTREEFI